MTKRKSPKPGIDELIVRLLAEKQQRRQNRSKKLKLGKRALRYAEAELEAAQKALKWLRSRSWYQDGLEAEDALLAVEQRWRRAIVLRMRQAARGESRKPASLTRMLVTISKHLRPKGVPAGERSEHCRKISNLLRAHGLRVSPDSIHQSLRNYHLRHPRDGVLKDR